mmetsp:Transcript_10981/g.17954  ORF Transcript_10981/g.17954 Transcript_10981/m.17954 type:complete len:828 (+) Transcript_10981:247-2730(+)|eukprot:CAMPEP_0184656622 /NCGR_PEP_ID=MMETSP0308-20130426/16635_1 /TAXON_ID=38269 /ORGANISM="Gloeochaete witrockiana, Strain SAG 46.84" /LENGTH=827 /DNA_ID=CAMNT_0027093827 /DNA_START=246 /DNA_END=2729 /DNA_ORIENTATION=-
MGKRHAFPKSTTSSGHLVWSLVVVSLIALSSASLQSSTADLFSDLLKSSSKFPSSTIIDRLTTSSCPKQCSSRGLCFAGTCTCDPGFSGTDCSVGGFSEIVQLARESDVLRAKSNRFSDSSLPPLDFAKLPSLASLSPKSLRICIVVGSGEAGVSHQILAESLAKAGNKVHIVVVPGATDVVADARRDLGVAVTRLPQSDLRYPSQHLAHSYDTFLWLRSQSPSFDVVHFIDSAHIPYYSLLAKRQKVALMSSALVVVTPAIPHSSHFFDLPESVDALEVEFMERQGLEMADALIGARQDAVPHGVRVPSDAFFDSQVFNPLEFFSASTRWQNFQSWVVSQHTEVKETTDNESELPLVTVAVVHRNRPAFVKQALKSIEEQDYLNFEVVLVDDGSDTAEALALLDELEPQFEKKGWRVIRQANKYLGAARNAAAKHARGEYILFMDDDNIAKSHEISTLVRAARSTGADVLTAFVSFFYGKSGPQAEDSKRPPFVFLGGAAGIGAFRNCYGDANAMIRISTFFEIGGFTEDFGVGYEDWEFFAKATMMGKQVQVIPEPLYWYRFTPGSMQRTTQMRQNRDRSLRPYLDSVPSSLKNLLGNSQEAVGAVGSNSATQSRSSTTGSRKLLQFYGFYGIDFYGTTITASPAPLPTVAAFTTVQLTLNATCAQFNVTVSKLISWAAEYLKVPVSIISAKSNCPTAVNSKYGLLAVGDEQQVVVTYTIYSLTYGTPNWPSGSESQTLAKAIQSADSIYGIAIVNTTPLESTGGASSSGGSSMLGAYIAIPIALVAAVAVVAAVVGYKVYKKRQAGFGSADLAASPVDDNVIYV